MMKKVRKYKNKNQTKFWCFMMKKVWKYKNFLGKIFRVQFFLDWHKLLQSCSVYTTFDDYP